MALKKKIELETGIILNYHRIVSINKITNVQNIYEVASYVSEKQRKIEERYQELQKRSANGEELTKEENDELEKGINVFINTQYLSKDYNENINIGNVYDYLKTTKEFEGAEDI